MTERYDDEINLRDYINVLIKRKVTILVVFFLSVALAAIYSFTTPKVYKVYQIIKVPTVGMNKFLDSPIKVKERIEEDVYNQKIKEALNLDQDSQFKFQFIVPEENIFIKISLKTAQDKIDKSKAILEELTHQLENDYAPEIFTKITKINNDITLKENQIERENQEIKTLTATIKLTKERIASLEKELERVNANVENLRSERAGFIKPSAGKDNIATVLYAITIQQAIRYSNQLEDQLNSLKTKKEQKENALKGIEKDIENIKIAIRELEMNRKFINNIKQLQLPIRSEKAIAPKKRQNVAIAGLIGLMLGVFLAFFREFWVSSTGRE